MKKIILFFWYLYCNNLLYNLEELSNYRTTNWN